MHEKTFDLLRLLSDADVCSAQALASKLGTPSAIVALAAAELEQLGLRVSSVPGGAYRLAEPYEFLDASAVYARLGAFAPRFRLELIDACTSTNTRLLESARGGAPAGTLIACELQSAGRGRRGNSWQSALSGGLTFSLLWRFAQNVAGLSGLSLAVGVAVARALAAVGVPDVQLKWPNDLLHGGRKLGGILIEVQGSASEPAAAVIGIGLNLRLPARLRDAIAQDATDIACISNEVPQRNRLLAATLVELAPVLDSFAAYGFAPLREEWIARHAHQGKAVTLSAADGKGVSGTAAGVADDGALLVETADGIKRFVSGELSLRASAS